MCAKICYSIQNVFTLASRERCLSHIRKLVVPRSGQLATRHVAVLVPLVRVDNVPSLLYTVRAGDSALTGGDISFPGGHKERCDSDIATALRDAEEEIGLMPAKVDVWGRGPGVPARGGAQLVTPVLGAVNHLLPSDLHIERSLVREVFTVPLEILCDPANHFYTQFKEGSVLPVFIAEQFKIWGVTAYITHAFLSSILSKEYYCNDWITKRNIMAEK